MNLVFVLIPLTSAAYNLTGVVFFSPLTPTCIQTDFNRTLDLSSRDIKVTFISYELLKYLESQPVHVVFDYTFSLTHSLTLKSFAQSLKIPYFSARDPPEIFDSISNEYFLHSNEEDVTYVINSFLQYLNLTDFFVASSSSFEDSAVQIGNVDLFSTLSPQFLYDKYAIQTIKPSGNWKIVTLGDKSISYKMFEALKKADIYKERCIFIVGGRGGINKFDVGTLVVGEDGLGQAESLGEFEGLSVIRAFDLLTRLDTFNILESLEDITIDHKIVTNYTIYNYNGDGVKERIGKISPREIELFSNIVYPGNVSEYITSKPIIKIAANLGLVDYDGTFNIPHSLMTLGLEPMVSIINADDSLLRNHELQLYGTDCGSMNFNYEYVKNCMDKHKDNLKGFFIESSSPEMIRGNIQVFEDIGIRIPHITSRIDDKDLYSKTSYPSLLITSGYLEFLYSILPFILASFGWKNIILLQSLSDKNYHIFTHNCEALGINILNSNTYVEIDRSSESYSQYTHHFEEIRGIPCRILVSLLSNPLDLLFASWLYDFGFRKGDLVFISSSRSSSYIDNTNGTYRHNPSKVMEIIDGSISIDFFEYVGEYGTNIKEKLAPLIAPNTTDYTSFLIDSMLLGVHTLDTLINIGFDHENSDLVEKFIRKENFLGTSGTISIDSRGNGINEIRFGIFNFYVNNTEWIEDHIGDYTLGVLVPLNFSREVIWSNGSLVIPEDLIKDIPCTNSEHPDESSLLIIYIILGVCAVCVLAITWLTFRVQLDWLEEVRDITYEDAILMYTPVIEVLQYSGIGPQLNPVLFFLGSIASLELEALANPMIRDFWEIYFVILGVVIVWIICVTLPPTRVFGRLHGKIQDFIYCIGFIFFTYIAQIGFIPVVNTLLKIFMCSQSFNYDCEMTCWRGLHLFLTILSGFIILCFVILSVFMKYVVDYNMEAVNINTLPLFVCLKTLLHLILVFIHFGRFDNSEIYLFVCFAVWFLIVYFIEPYNYRRFNFWQKILVFLCLLNSVYNLVYGLLEQNVELLIVLQLLSISTCAIGGLFIQWKKYPSMLYRKPGSDIEKLIKFAFGRGVTEKDLTIREFKYVDREPRGEEVLVEILT